MLKKTVKMMSKKVRFYLKVAKENGYDIGTVFERYIRN